MNDVVVVEPLPEQLIADAKSAAAASKRRVVDVLEERYARKESED